MSFSFNGNKKQGLPNHRGRPKCIIAVSPNVHELLLTSAKTEKKLLRDLADRYIIAGMMAVHNVTREDLELIRLNYLKNKREKH